MKVVKFGGTSMATPESIRQVACLLERSRPEVCVVSAPGRSGNLPKVTDLLYEVKMEQCLKRISALAAGLGLGAKTIEHAEEKLRELKSGPLPALVSYGEYMSAYLLATLTGRRFIDAKDVIGFTGERVKVNICWETDEHIVVPGFYGIDLKTKVIRLFPRGGSDITASYIAKAIEADVCINWTDVSGIYDKDPRHHKDATVYKYLDYDSLFAITHAGAVVFHPEAVAPLQEAGIPLLIRNTFAPEDAGTTIYRSP